MVILSILSGGGYKLYYSSEFLSKLYQFDLSSKHDLTTRQDPPTNELSTRELFGFWFRDDGKKNCIQLIKALSLNMI